MVFKVLKYVSKQILFSHKMYNKHVNVNACEEFYGIIVLKGETRSNTGIPKVVVTSKN